MQSFNFRARGVSVDHATQWPFDPTVELEFEELLGLRDPPFRPPVPRPRIALFRSKTRTVALTEGWLSHPTIVEVVRGPSAPVRHARSSRTPKGEDKSRTQEATSASASTTSSRVENEDLLTTQAAALYCGYLDGVSLRKAKFDDRIQPAAVGKNRCYLWRRSDLDKLNRRRSYVPEVVPCVNGAGPRDQHLGESEPAGSTEMPASADLTRPSVEASIAAIAPVVDAVTAADVVSPPPSNGSSDDVTPLEVCFPSIADAGAAENTPGCSGSTDRRRLPGSAQMQAPAAHEATRRTATDRPNVVPLISRQRRPLADVLRRVLTWEVLAAEAEQSDIPVVSCEVPLTLAGQSVRGKAGVPYRGTRIAQLRRRATG